MAVPTNIKTLLAGTAVEWAWIEFTILIHPHFLPSSGDKNGTKDGTKSGTKKSAAMNRAERVQLILAAIKEDSNITVRAMVEDLGIAKNTLLRIIKELQ